MAAPLVDSHAHLFTSDVPLAATANVTAPPGVAAVALGGVTITGGLDVPLAGVTVSVAAALVTEPMALLTRTL